MSQENVEIVREAIEAFNRGDFEAALKRMHRDIEWQTLDAFPDAETYRGREEVRGSGRCGGTRFEAFGCTWRNVCR
jgi:ketosteroid isomerase-like protein